MSGFSTDIEEATKNNENFRKVLYTAPHSQLVVMTLQPGEDIGTERHDTVDQFIRIEEGEAEAIIDGETHRLPEDSVVVIPAGSTHNVINKSSTETLHLYTIYSPAQHPDGTVHRTKQEAMAAEHH